MKKTQARKSTESSLKLTGNGQSDGWSTDAQNELSRVIIGAIATLVFVAGMIFIAI